MNLICECGMLMPHIQYVVPLSFWVSKDSTIVVVSQELLKGGEHGVSPFLIVTIQIMFCTV